MVMLFQVTFTFLAPVLGFSLVKFGRPEGIDTSRLSDVIVGGGPATSEQMTDLRRVLPGANVTLGYGMTELVGIGTAFKPNVSKDMELTLKYPNSSGVPMPGLTFKVNVCVNNNAGASCLLLFRWWILKQTRVLARTRWASYV